jgi:hypothetical protein
VMLSDSTLARIAGALRHVLPIAQANRLDVRGVRQGQAWNGKAAVRHGKVR